MRKSFILHHDLMETIDLLPNAEAGKFLKALFHYSAYGEIPEKLTGSTQIVFSLVRAQIDRDIAKYEKICTQRAEAGKKGAEVVHSRGKTAETSTPEQTKTEPLLQYRERLRQNMGITG